MEVSASTTLVTQTAPASAEQPPGTVFIPGFRIEHILGSGGMGIVYVAEELSLGRKVALKTIGGGAREGAAFHERFLREARLMASVEDPNVVRVYSFGEADGRHYLAMEYVEGESLAGRLRRVGPLSVEQALRIAMQVAFGLRAAAAKGVVHRDVKPANILIDQRDNARVADFGLSRSLDGTPSDLSQSAQFLGTPQYAAPEQANGNDVAIQTDMYALGAVMFETLTGHPPFTGTSIAVIAKHLHEPFPRLRRERGDVPVRLQQLIDRMTNKEPTQRPRSWDEVIDEIKEITRLFSPPLSAIDFLRVRITSGTLLVSFGMMLVLPVAIFCLWLMTMAILRLVVGAMTGDSLPWFREHVITVLVISGAATITEVLLLIAIAQRARDAFRRWRMR